VVEDLQGLWQEALDDACSVYVGVWRDESFQAPLILAAEVIE
jgi:hypothetical protein